jgi:hypothetical protein
VVVKKPSAKSTKAEILEAFDELEKEKSELKSQMDKLAKNLPVQTTKEQPILPITKEVMNQSQSVQQKMNYTIESLAKVQMGFGTAVSELSEQLTTKASGLEKLRGAVATEIQQLEELHDLEITTDTLDNLIQSYEQNAQTFVEEVSLRKETLAQEFLQQKKTWELEQEEYKRLLKESYDERNKTTQREAAEYKYNLELQRKLSTDEYEQVQNKLNNELEEFRQLQEKQWLEREKAVFEREQQVAEAKNKVESFAKEKELAVKRATEEGKGIAHYQAKIKTDLYAKDVEGQKRFYEQRLESLEQTIHNQETRIQGLARQLESALKQVQDLAVKAIEGAANINSYQAVKEIAIEQAKTQVKNK